MSLKVKIRQLGMTWGHMLSWRTTTLLRFVEPFVRAAVFSWVDDRGAPFAATTVRVAEFDVGIA